MKKNQAWIKIPTLVLFFGAMTCFVAYRAGAFSGPQQAANLASVSDSPKVSTTPMIHSTKSGKIIQSEPVIMPSSKSMVLPEIKSANPPDSVKKSSTAPQSMKKRKMSKQAKQKVNASKNKSNANNTIMPSSKSGPMFAPDKAE